MSFQKELTMPNKTTTEEWKTCCRKEIIKLWVESGSMDIVHYQGECPECKHFIGLTQTPEEEAREFIERTISSTKQEERERINKILLEKMPDALHNYGAYILNNKETQPLERRAMKKSMTEAFIKVYFLTTLKERE